MRLNDSLQTYISNSVLKSNPLQKKDSQNKTIYNQSANSTASSAAM